MTEDLKKFIGLTIVAFVSFIWGFFAADVYCTAVYGFSLFGR